MKSRQVKERNAMSKEPTAVPNIEEGSGDVFADLGLEMSEIDMLKVHLALAINITIQKRALTQTEAARLMGTDQSKVSKILRGQLTGFAEHRLMEFLLRLGRDIEFRIPERCRGERGQIRVMKRACG